ncbi:hypothetical protein [Sphingopyxis sp.]|uniref:hypothetical protein n=1 Tax=Sphingopyxis sp. TaxID=1908224 RepID=UPI002D7EF0EB|nr:hypothetical protein [Sphingopyxis sp.]
MKQTYPLPVHHSWPLYERDRYFKLGQLHGSDAPESVAYVAMACKMGRSGAAVSGGGSAISPTTA